MGSLSGFNYKDKLFKTADDASAWTCTPSIACRRAEDPGLVFSSAILVLSVLNLVYNCLNNPA